MKFTLHAKGQRKFVEKSTKSVSFAGATFGQKCHSVVSACFGEHPVGSPSEAAGSYLGEWRAASAAECGLVRDYQLSGYCEEI